MDLEVIARTEASRTRMRRLIGGMSDEDLARPLGDGSDWTVAATLAHIAFWDRRTLVLLERWERAEIGPSPVDYDAVNDAMVPQWLALPPRVAAEQALATAEEVDRAVAGLTAERVTAIQAIDVPIRLDRSQHRTAHLDAIDNALGVGR